MHAFTVGAAVISLMRWLSELRERLPKDGPPMLRQQVSKINMINTKTDKGKETTSCKKYQVNNHRERERGRNKARKKGKRNDRM